MSDASGPGHELQNLIGVKMLKTSGLPYRPDQCLHQLLQKQMHTVTALTAHRPLSRQVKSYLIVCFLCTLPVPGRHSRMNQGYQGLC